MEIGFGALRDGGGNFARDQQPGMVIFRHGFSLDRQTSRAYETADTAVNVDWMNQLLGNVEPPISACGSLPAAIPFLSSQLSASPHATRVSGKPWCDPHRQSAQMLIQ
jgi:hypothetical protein